MKDKKPLTRRQEIRELRERIGALKDSHRVLLRKDVTPLMKRLVVLECAEKLARAERALVRSVEAEKGNPQLELLGLDATAEATAAKARTPAQASFDALTAAELAVSGDSQAEAPLLAQSGSLGQ
jgi:hypothetical protein